MSRFARARLFAVPLVAGIIVAGLSFPAMAEEPATRSLDPATYTPPFALSAPVDGVDRYSDSFGVIRDDGDRLHHGIDIGAPLGTHVLAAAPGVVVSIEEGGTAGLYVEIEHSDGWRTRYLHLNNVEPEPDPAAEEEALAAAEGAEPEDEAPADDVPADEAPPAEETAETTEAAGTDEPGAEEPEEVPIEHKGWGIPDGIEVGVSVEVGDVIGYVGYSGNASINAPHLHFELRMPDRTPVNPHPFLTGEAGPRTLYVVPDITEEPAATSIEIVGHIETPEGFNSDIWVHDGIAYLGAMGTEDVCPATGVRRYDLADVAQPVELSAISNSYPGTYVADVWAGDVVTPAFSGTLAMVAHSPCASGELDGAFSGLVVYDVSDPAEPMTLARYEAGVGTAGISDFDVWSGEGVVRVLAAAPNSRIDHDERLGDVRIIDLSDPAAPRDIADWDFRRDAPPTMRGAVTAANDLRDLHAAGVAFGADGERAFVAHWDAGLVVLDLSDPENPSFIGRDASLGHSEGNARSVAFDAASGIVIVNHEDLDPLDGEVLEASWGVEVAFDANSDGDPLLLSTYSVDAAAPDSDGRVPLEGLYTPRDAVVSGHYLYAIWLSGGLRVVSLTDPEEPVEVASFIPPTRVDPQRVFEAPNGNIGMPLAWSVHIDDDLIYLSDLNTGLWILRLEQPPLGGR